MGELAIHDLRPDEIDKAYILARLGYRDLGIAAWRDMAEATLGHTDTAGSVLFAQDQDKRARGLLIYKIAPTVAGKPSLRVERLVAFDLMDPQLVADAMLAEVMRLARLKDCGSFSLVSPMDAATDPAALVLASPVSVLHRVF